MFQPLAARVGLARLFLYRPADLVEYLERCWEACSNAPLLGVQALPALIEEFQARARPYRSDTPSAIAPLPRPTDPVLGAALPALPPLPPALQVVPPVPTATLWPWRHIIYAYMLENTRIIEIFRRIVDEFVHGERLGRPGWEVERWTRNTEELFFSDRFGSAIMNLSSQLRPDGSAMRRNAYCRLLGMDLNHGLDDGKPLTYRRPDIANRDFAATFERLLRETWRGYANRFNGIGPNQTDPSAMSDLCRRMRQMLQDRRLNGALAREEFVAGAVLSWFHMTVWTNSALLTFLQTIGTEPSERLRLVGQRVGLAPHSRSYSYFQMAAPLSNVLWRLEAGLFDNPGGAQTLYMGGAVTDWMLRIIQHWSVATGRNLKEFVGAPEPARRVAALA